MTTVSLDMLHELLTTTVRQEIAGMSKDVKDLKTDLSGLMYDMETIKYTLGNQAARLNAAGSDVASLKQSARGQSKDLHQLAVLFEDLDGRFEAVAVAR